MIDRGAQYELARNRPWWRGTTFDVISFVVGCLFVAWIVYRGAAGIGYNWQWYRVPQYIYKVIDGELIWGPLIRGLLVTLEIGLYSAVLTIVIGLITTLLRLSRSFSGNLLATAYLEIIRNTPLLVQMFVFYFVIGPILGIDRFWVAVLALAFFEGSFAAEIIRAGIVSVPKGQWEAASSIGLSRFAIYRRVVLPQAIPLMLPPMTGLLVNLIKNSAIVSVIAVFDLTTEGRNIIADTYMSFEIWFTVALIYLSITIPLSLFVGMLERRIRQST